jgi:hypothetical protein
MSAFPPPAEIEEDDDVWERRLLREMAEGGAEICRYMQGRVIRAVMAGDDAAVASLASAHAREARSVRMCIAQRRKLRQLREHEARREEAARAGAAGPAEAAAEAEETRLMVRYRLWSLYGKDKVREVAALAIATERPEAERERLLADLDRRLDGEEAVSLAEMPIGRAIRQVCADLGLDPDWSLWKHQTWAIESDLPGVPKPGPTGHAQGPP